MHKPPIDVHSAYQAGRYELARELLLEEYTRKPVRRLLQVDGHDVGPEGDDIMNPDENGHCATFQVTHELLTVGGTRDLPVRVLIYEDADKEEVLALLHKISDWVERDFYQLKLQARGLSGPETPYPEGRKDP